MCKYLASPRLCFAVYRGDRVPFHLALVCGVCFGLGLVCFAQGYKIATRSEICVTPAIVSVCLQGMKGV